MEENNSKKDYEVSKKDSYYGIGSFLWEIAKVFALALIIIAPIRIFLFQPFFVQGASMEPNFENGEYLIVNELGYKNAKVGFNNLNLISVQPFKELQRGEAVVFRYPKNPEQYFIKRIIGLPGEKIEIKDGKVIIYNKENADGVILDEGSYLKSDVMTNGELTVQLSESEYFVMGDNRSYSSDSRSWGPVPKNDIIGRVLIRAWPVNRAGIY
jgi:signal peptidase I